MSHEHLGWLHDEPENVPDGHFIREMLVEITPAEAQEKHWGWGLVGWNPDPGGRYFTCKHWDEQTRLCGVYEDRPKMCRDHPCGVCQFGCGLSD